MENIEETEKSESCEGKSPSSRYFFIIKNLKLNNNEEYYI